MAKTPPRAADYLRFADLLDSLPQPAAIIRYDHRILAANRSYRDKFAEGGDVRGKHCYRVSHKFANPCHEAGVSCPLPEVLSTGKCCRLLHIHYGSDGDQQEEISSFPVMDPNGNVQSVLEILGPHSTEGIGVEGTSGAMVGQSEPFNRMMSLAAQVAPTDSAVLLLGESGTGKELMAKTLHKLSKRSRGNFVPVACTGLPESLLESELFGHEKGSFTGASRRKIGLVEASHGGTLFLDEIGDMPSSLQVKLLRVLDKRVFRRVGSAEEHFSDFRLLCATHRDLVEMVQLGEFRHDLYYRISAFPICIPAMRERIEDLPVLIDSIRLRLGCGRGCVPDSKAMEMLFKYSFPGNIRELINILERACLLANGNKISVRHLPAELHCEMPKGANAGPGGILPLEEIERRYLRWAATSFRGSRQELAAQLGLSERSLYRKLERVRSDPRPR